MNFLSGFLASVTVSSTGYTFDKFSISESAALAKVTNFTSSGAQLMIPGIYSATVSCSGPYDAGAMTAFAPNASITLILGFNTGVTISVPTIVTSCKLTADVIDAQRIEVEFASTGTFTLGPP